MKTKIITTILLVFFTSITAQEYIKFDKPVEVKGIAKLRIRNEAKPYSDVICISDSDTLKIMGYKNKMFYAIVDDCEGFIASTSFYSTPLLDVYKRAASHKELALAEIEASESLNNFSTECEYTSNEVDEFNGDRVLFTKDLKVSDDLWVTFKRINNDKYIVFEAMDLGCTAPFSYQNKSFVKVKLENDDILTFYHRGKIDCNHFNLMGKVSNSEIKRLKESPIKSIRLLGTDSFFDVDDLKRPSVFQDMLSCIESFPAN